MNEIKTITELLGVLKTRSDIFQEINGKKYNLNVVTVLQMSLGDLLKLVNDGVLFYDVTA